uniref:Sodium/solute symporter n=1 Tax=Anopheles atroparvus TaxID=41427 RepID=A0A182JJ80_ANOAO
MSCCRFPHGSFDPNPTTRHTVFSVIIGGFFYWTSLFCTNQASVQKCMSLKSLKTAKHALYFSLLGLIAVFLMNFYTGLMTFAHYSDCDPLAAGQITAKDQLLPFYVMDVFGHIKFMTGIFVAGIFAASLGTVAAALNSLAAVTCEDLLVTGMEVKIPDGKGALYAKWMSLGFGLASFGLVFVVERLGGILQATLTLNGLIGGVTLGLFSLGIFFSRANSKGALFGGISALLLVIVVGVMAQLNNEEPAPLPTSVEGCNASASSWHNPDQQGMEYDVHPMDGSVSLALHLATGSHIDQSGAVESMLNIVGHDEWNDADTAYHVYSHADNPSQPSLDTGDNVKARQDEDSDDSSSWLASVYGISYMWYSCLGTLLTLLFGIIISVLTSEEALGCCTRRNSSSIQSELPTTAIQNSISPKESIQPSGEKRSKLSVGSMAPLAMMMRTSVTLSPCPGPRRLQPKQSPSNGASVDSSMASVCSIDQQTISSELGSYTEEDRREDARRAANMEALSSNSYEQGSTFPSTVSMKMESERF